MPILDPLAPREILLEGRREPEMYMPIVAETPWAKLKHLYFCVHASHEHVSLMEVFVRLDWKSDKIAGVKGYLTLRTPRGEILASKTAWLARSTSSLRSIKGGVRPSPQPLLCFEIPGAHHAEVDQFEIRLVVVEAKKER
jgi:hypothetical protein